MSSVELKNTPIENRQRESKRKAEKYTPDLLRYDSKRLTVIRALPLCSIPKGLPGYDSRAYHTNA